MPPIQKHPIFTKQDYLDFERHQDNRHEFLDGSVYAMAGESPVSYTHLTLPTTPYV